MKASKRGRRRAGRFFLHPDKTIYGELKIRGEATTLYLQDREFFSTNELPNRCIKGVLHDLTRVTLIDCVAPRSPGTFSSGNDGYYYAKIFPHFIVQGDKHIDPGSPTIRTIFFVLDDAPQLFEDLDTLGFVLFDAQPTVEHILKKHTPNRLVETGKEAQLIYFTGKTKICTVDTVYGTIDIERRPRFSSDGWDSASLRNQVVCSIQFPAAVDFQESIFRASILINYFGMLAGRPQNLQSLNIHIESEGDEVDSLAVSWSYAPRRDKSNAWKSPNSFDVLLDGARDPRQFARVLNNWLARHEEWHAARWRFFRSFEKQRQYDPDRLIGAANMFDILPSSAAPLNAPLTPDLELACQESRALFRKLPKSLERDSILNAFGRLGKSHLKHKIHYRVDKIIDVGSEWFPELLKVADEAVNCRNYYVHGTAARFDYERNFDLVTFLTDTLEFVFAASDLLEAGWDIRPWAVRGTTMSHPFGRYLANYPFALKHLNEVLEDAKQAAIR